VRQLGEQSGRGFAEANLSTFEAVLFGAADSLLQGMAEAGEDEEVAQAAVDLFRKGARDEWTRVSRALKNATPGRA
jgi:ketosteroid isomerase-like protein